MVEYLENFLNEYGSERILKICSYLPKLW